MILLTLINSIVLMALLMLIGYYIRYKGILSDDGESSLTYLLVNITAPAMIANSMIIDFSFEQLKTGAILIALSVAFEFFLILLGNIATIKNKDIEKKNMIKDSVAFMNGGFMGFPLAYQLYGSQGMFYATMFYTPNTIFLWTYGISVLLRNKKIENRYRVMFLNPGMIGVYIGLFLYFTQLPLPLFATKLLDLLTNVTTALSMIIIGSKIANIGVKDSLINKEAYFASFFRLIASPIFMIILMKFLNLDQMVEQIYVIYAALPVAAIIPIFAQKYGGDSNFGSKIVVITHLASLITIPLFFWLYSII